MITLAACIIMGVVAWGILSLFWLLLKGLALVFGAGIRVVVWILGAVILGSILVGIASFALPFIVIGFIAAGATLFAKAA